LSGDVETASLHAEPRLLVEAVGDGLAAGSGGQSEARDGQKYAPGTPFLYRITSRSQGGSGAVIRVTESVYTTDLNIGNAGANPDDTP
jgi:type IV pilus assembly protein PilX